MSGLFAIRTYTDEECVENQYLNTHKASFRTELQIDNKETYFQGKKALLFISVGQAYHEEGKFLSTIELVNKYQFKSCDIVMADTLQRHNFKGAMGNYQAYEYTKNAGDIWLKRNQMALEQLKHQHQIIRWDELLFHKDYTNYRKLIDEEIARNEDYREALSSNARIYIERLQNINPNVAEEELFANGLEYLVEEMPIVMPMWADMGYEIIIYPKPQTLGMKKTYEIFVQDKHPEKCQWVFMRFKKCKPSSIHQTTDAYEAVHVLS
jgi:tRNA-dependent cyclodipeptide synthase